jgi:hypothetical protein
MQCDNCGTRLNRFKVVVFGAEYCPKHAPISAALGGRATA